MFTFGTKVSETFVPMSAFPPYDTLCSLLVSLTLPIATCPRISYFSVQVEAKYHNQIKVFYSATCDSIEQLPGGAGIEVRASLRAGGGGEKGIGEGKKVFRPRLLVGADGLNSMVSGPFAAGMGGQKAAGGPVDGRKRGGRKVF